MAIYFRGNKVASDFSLNSLPVYPAFDNTKAYILALRPNQAGTAWELVWVEDTMVREGE